MLTRSFFDHLACKIKPAITIFLWSVIMALPASAQSLSGFDRERGRQMLQALKSDIKKYYYDPNYRGIDLDARFKEADNKIKQATSIGQMFGIIAQVLLDFNDSHTIFIPPDRAATTDYGWLPQMIGDKCFVVGVRPGSDAEAKGLKVGDEILSVDGFFPSREDFWKLEYLYYFLRPKPGMRIVAQSPGAQSRQIDVLAKVTKRKLIRSFYNGQDLGEMEREAERDAHVRRHRYQEIGKELFIWKMPQFDLEDGEVDSMMDKAKRSKALIIDMRGNGGGRETTMKRLIGSFFNHEIKIGDVKRREDTKPLIAKPRGSNYFEGDLIVLVDSESSSAAEVFARVIQIEKRGIVIGDRTSGKVMRSRYYGHESGLDIVAFYGASITDADLVMTDGKSLEGVGVKPDELLLPSGAALAASRDPVLARAAALAGVTLDPAKAGALFPIEWK